MGLKQIVKGIKKFNGNIIHKLHLASIEDNLRLPQTMSLEEKIFCIDFNSQWANIYRKLFMVLPTEAGKGNQFKLTVIENRIHPDARSQPEFFGFTAGFNKNPPLLSSNERYMLGYNRGLEYSYLKISQTNR